MYVRVSNFTLKINFSISQQNLITYVTPSIHCSSFYCRIWSYQVIDTVFLNNPFSKRFLKPCTCSPSIGCFLLCVICVSMLLNNSWICLNMSEAEPKKLYELNSTKVQHLGIQQIHRSIQNPAKYLKWSKKELLAKIITLWNYFPKTLQYI